MRQRRFCGRDRRPGFHPMCSGVGSAHVLARSFLARFRSGGLTAVAKAIDQHIKPGVAMSLPKSSAVPNPHACHKSNRRKPGTAR